MVDKSEQIAEARRKLLEKRLKAKRQAAKSEAVEDSFPKFPEGKPVPATYGQQSLWYVQQIAPESAVYNMANVMRIEGKLNLAWLQQSLDTVIARHEILRTNFVMIDGELLQQINPPHAVALTVVPIEPDNLEQAIYRHIEAPFDLEYEPLFRVTLLQESETVHVMIMAMHHIIGDKWSQEVLIWREIAEVYTALSEGLEPDLAPVKAQFKDFTAWQSQKADTDSYQAKMDYWENELSHAPALLQLPIDKPRPPQQQFDGEVLYDTLPAILTEPLQDLSKANGTTLFMTLMAAYMLLLHRMSREDDILVGTSVDLRTHAALEQTIGYFLNTVVLRQQFDADITFTTLLGQVKERLLKAFANQDIEFENLVTHLKPERDPSYNPIFQTMFVMWDTNNTEPEIPHLTLKTIKLDPNIAKFDLTLYAQVNADNTLLLAIEYATSLFEDDTVQRLMDVYQTLLESIIKMPDASIHTLNWLPDEQHKILLNDWTQTQTDYPREQLLHEMIAAQNPDAQAIVFDDISVSYGDLNQRANQVAHYLVEEGVKPNQPVAMIVERSPEMLIGILGILKAGGAYVPIDPDYPTERVQFMLEDSGASIVLMQSQLEADLLANVKRADLDEDRLFSGLSDTAPTVDANPDDLAYMIYTSGSTGTPKGVRVSHRNLVHSTTARFTVYEHSIERFLLLSSFAFDSSLVGIFWTLAGGGTLILPRQGIERDAVQIATTIQDQRITHLLALPSLYAILLEFGQEINLSSLNTVIVAGEACPTTLVQAHYQQLPDAILYNEYGPTEGTVWATVSKIEPNAEQVTIGRAIPNMQTYIVDTALSPVPIGVAGELVIGGEGITQGYHNRPQLTKERFIDNPFGDSSKLYRTGDLVRYLANGEIEFLGRIDRQVKISGYRIEIGEIENAISQLSGIHEAVVIAHDVGQIKQLIGFYTTSHTADAKAIKAQLRSQLPHYMVPQRLIALDAIPRTPNGKIDQKHLSTLVPAQTSEVTDTVTATGSDDIEQQLIDIWQELLGVPITDTHAEFFALGGYSLLAIRMFAQVNQTFEKDLPVSTIFEAPTIAQLADLIRSDYVADETILTLQEGIEGNMPIYCVQVNKFGVLQYQQFIDTVDDKFPLYGLSVPPSVQQDADFIQVKEAGKLFAEAIIKQQPQGHIALLGLSLAGTVAYEVARLLIEHGIDASVIMVDTQGPDFPTSQPTLQALQQKSKLIVQEFQDTPPQQWGDILGQMAHVAQIRVGFQINKRGNWLLAKLGLPQIYDRERADLRIGGENVKGFTNTYFASNPTSEVDILLYRGRLQPISSQYEWALGWDKLVPDEHIETYTVVGQHNALLKHPYLPRLLNHLEHWLDNHSN